LPAPTSLDQIGSPKISLPTGPIEPFLIQKENGPFMVLAYTFRGPQADRYAQALVLELRGKFGLQAYIFYAKVQPGHSNIRDIPPTAPPYVRNGEMAAPEKYRNYDEAAVLVGDCKTIDESKQLLHKVKKLHPACLDGLPSIYNWRRGRGLSRAILTTNPLVAAQYLYPGKGVMPVVKPGQPFDPAVVTASFETIHKKDPLVKQINTGPYNIYKCRGPYVLQVAEFSGRTSLNNGGTSVSADSAQDLSSLLSRGYKRDDVMDLSQAGEQAERLADAIAHSKLLGKLHPYVYHDRFVSRVYLGPFESPKDHALTDLLKDPETGTVVPNFSAQPYKRSFSKLVQISNEIVIKSQDPKNKDSRFKGITTLLIPAPELTAIGPD
jgi:hypothetical protein